MKIEVKVRDGQLKIFGPVQIEFLKEGGVGTRILAYRCKRLQLLQWGMGSRLRNRPKCS